MIPSIEFDSSSDPDAVWNGHASQVDVGNARVITSSLSGPSRETADALEGDRPAHEYGNDPQYIDGMLGLRATTRAEAVTQALGPLVGSGRMNVGEAERPHGTKRGLSRRTKRIAAVAVPVALAAGAFGVVSLVDDSAQVDVVADTVAQDVAGEPDPEPAIDETAAGEAEPIEQPTEGLPPADEVEADEPAAAPGTYEITGRVAGACGNYDVFLRMVLFLNGQVTIEQLLTAGAMPSRARRVGGPHR